MKDFHVSAVLLLALALILVSSGSIKAFASENGMKSFFSSQMSGMSIEVNGTAHSRPGQNITLVMIVNATAQIHVQNISLEAFGFVNGTDEILMGGISDSNFDMNGTSKNYAITIAVPVDVWGVTYGEIRIAYSANYSGIVLSFPNAGNGFVMTQVENTLVENLQEQVKSLNDSNSQLSHEYANLTEEFADLNQSYWNLQGNYTTAQGTLGELDGTRRLSTVLAITTVFFFATTVYIVVRRPRDYW
jgi:hypothetical protein